jgi:hypothetical protein
METYQSLAKAVAEEPSFWCFLQTAGVQVAAAPCRCRYVSGVPLSKTMNKPNEMWFWYNQ